jgi:hypothetical protein
MEKAQPTIFKAQEKEKLRVSEVPDILLPRRTP